jgi:oligopeptide transport system substrate-binding protein
MKKHLLFCTLSGLLLTLSCRKNQETDGILNVTLGDNISSLDPANCYDSVCQEVLSQCGEALYDYHFLKRPYTLKPLLAESMPTIENNNLTYIIKIKKDVYYHPSEAFKGQKREVRAEDFITQIKRIVFTPLRSQGSWLFVDNIKGLKEFSDAAGSDIEKMFSLPISGLTALDPYTLKIELTKPYPQLMYAFAMSFAFPVPEEVIRFYNNNLTRVCVGTGPFTIQPIHNENQITLKRNPEYRDEYYPTESSEENRHLLGSAGKKIPFLKGIEFHVMKEAQTRWIQFQDGRLDTIGIPKDNFSMAIDSKGQLKKEFQDKNMSLVIAPTLTYWWLGFNMQDPLFKNNLELRKAISYAIDRKRFLELFTNNTGQLAHSILPPGILGYDPTNEWPYEYNIELAKKALEKAGFPGGKGLPEIPFDLRSASSTARQTGDFFQTELKKVGINIRVELNTFPGFLKKNTQGQLRFWLDGWALDYPDAENALALLTTSAHPPGPNTTMYSSKKLDEVYAQMKIELDPTKKVSLIREIEKEVQQEIPWSMLYYQRDYYLKQQHVENFAPAPIIHNHYKYISLKQRKNP